MNFLDLPALRPIRGLLTDPSISEIMINGLGRLFVERAGKMESLHPPFATQHQLDAAVESLLGMTGRAVTALSPFVDFRLPDGSRVNVVIQPVALEGPVVTIRRASKGLQTIDDLIKRGALTQQMADFLRGCVAARINVVFSGGTGSGKTTLLGLLAKDIADTERIVVIEDTAELVMTQPNTVRMECRPPNIEGAGAITLTDLLKNALRMRPTRIILGEVRGDEAFDMLAALSSGHDGGFAVLHASSPDQAVARLAMMVLARGLPYPLWAIQNQIAEAVDLVVQHAQFADGTRRVTHITALDGVVAERVVTRDLFTWDADAVEPKTRAQGRYVCTGAQPPWFAKLKRALGARAKNLLEPSEEPAPKSMAARSDATIRMKRSDLR